MKKSIPPWVILSLICAPALAQPRGVYRAPRPRPPATAGALERDAVTGDYRLTYTDEEGESYTIPVEASDHVVFELSAGVQPDASYTAVVYTYKLINRAPQGGSAKPPFTMSLVPCKDPSLKVTSSEWSGHANRMKGFADRICDFLARGDGLAPGAALTDAKVTSAWLPGIGKAIVANAAEPPVWPSGEATPPGAVDLAASVNDMFAAGKEVEMVVPLRDPSSYVRADHGIGLVLEDLTKACGLGWVKAPGICNSLEVKLRHAQAAVLQNDVKVARNELGALRNELAAQRGKQVSDLAFALLDTNAGFILFHMGVP